MGGQVTVLFCLPQSSPVTVDTMNHASVALTVVLVLAGVWRYVARRSYGTPAAAYGTERPGGTGRGHHLTDRHRTNCRTKYGRMSDRAGRRFPGTEVPAGALAHPVIEQVTT